MPRFCCNGNERNGQHLEREVGAKGGFLKIEEVRRCGALVKSLRHRGEVEGAVAAR